MQSVVKANPNNVSQAQAIANKLGYPVETSAEIDEGAVIVVVGPPDSDVPPADNPPVDNPPAVFTPEGSGIGVTAEQGATCVN